MLHAFLMNIHKDHEQALVTLKLLREYYPESVVLLYLDGPSYTPDVQAQLRRLSSYAELRKYEPDKVKSTLGALSTLMLVAKGQGIDYASFLHADMIPTDRDQFQRFLGRFCRSSKALTHAPMWARHVFLSFCDLHFWVPECLKLGLFPFVRRPLPAEWGDCEECNEAHLTGHFCALYPDWRERLAYPLWTIVRPITGKEGADKKGHQQRLEWVIHNHTQETSVTHTNSESFWSNYRVIAR